MLLPIGNALGSTVIMPEGEWNRSGVGRVENLALPNLFSSSGMDIQSRANF